MEGQSQLGLRIDNYQGINATFINPSDAIFQKLGWNLNLVSTGVFFENNYAYLRNTSILNLRNKSIELESDPDFIETAMGDEVILAFDDPSGPIFFQGKSFVTGPSFSAGYKNHRFGIFINYRAEISEQNLSNELSYVKIDQQLPVPAFTVEPMKIGFMSWREIGINYATQFETSAGSVAIGANIKYLSGLDVLSAIIFRSSNVTKIDSTTYSVESIGAEAIGTTPILDAEANATDFNGSGIGIDIGFNYVIDDGGGDYKLKFGLAIRDLGVVNFDSNVNLFNYDTDNTFLLEKALYNDSFDDARGLFRQLSDDALGDPDAADAFISSYKFGLPTTININADYKFIDNVYLAALISQRIISAETDHLEGSNLLAIIPRYESKWLGLSLPVSVYNYSKVHVGLSARLAFLTIGTDHFDSLFTKKKLSGADVYVSLQLFKFWQGGFFGGDETKRGKGIKCYDF